jgi:hypothetical protein
MVIFIAVLEQAWQIQEFFVFKLYKNSLFWQRNKIGGCYMAPMWFPLILYLIIDIHVFLVIIPFGCIYMNSSNSSGLFRDVEIFVDCILISPLAPSTCTTVLECFCYVCTNNRGMTPELFFTPTYPSYDPTVNFPFNFLNFLSDALLCHLLFLPIILMHSIAICFFSLSNHQETTPLMAPRIAHQV